MAQTYPELIEHWEKEIAAHNNSQARAVMHKDGESAHLLEWRKAAGLAEVVLGELKAWREQADGYQASRELLHERFLDTSRQLRETTARLSWLEENAKRMQRGLMDLGTCPWCGEFSACEEGCELHTSYPDQATVIDDAREALGEFRL